MTDTPKPKSKRGKSGAPDAIHPAARYFLWLESPLVKSGFLFVIGLASIALGALDLIHHRHEYVSWAEWHGFYAWFGFASFAFAVLMGWPLRSLLGRKEDYYEKAAGDD